ncbi:hypothetical protein H5410_052647 [Solanum commersonii]|uniref:DUF4283 domain-containing protein n=1 Tax=Solanum commersonii TaxID=4109 RepID=A0A9J5X3Z6_SOLCO|nr:hypothetical protein H5410_052647 [Solanum commersonii]
MDSRQSIVAQPRKPPEPFNPSHTDFSPLNNLKITPNLENQRNPPNPLRNFAAVLGSANGSGIKKGVKLPHRSYDLIERKSVVSFSKEENGMLVDTCKLTIIGKFSRIRPSIDKIRDDFLKVVPFKGFVKIGAYSMHHVFIDFDLKEDHRNVYEKNLLTICNIQMKLLKIVAPIGVPIISDKAIVSKSRQTTTKVKVEIDIRRTRVTEIRIDVKYENVPKYCFHCKVQGHSDAKCIVLYPELRDTLINDNLDGKNEPHQSNNENMKNLPKI